MISKVDSLEKQISLLTRQLSESIRVASETETGFCKKEKEACLRFLCSHLQNTLTSCEVSNKRR